MYIDKKSIEAYKKLQASQTVFMQKIKDLSDKLSSVKERMKKLNGNIY